MKNLRTWLATAVLALLSACSFHQTPVTVLPVGPLHGAGVAESNDGYLIVYSAWDTANELYSVIHHSDYGLASADGKPLQKIKNRIDNYDENPRRVNLLPGSYRVLAEATGGNKVIAPVIIRGNETTLVYLDGSGPNRTGKRDSNSTVKLPNGDFVGWAAAPHTNE